MNIIKYHRAYNELGELVNIESVDKSYREAHTFRCVGCGGEMIAKLGKDRAPHFAHKLETDSCGSETYLHKLGKLVLKQRFDSSEPMEIEYRKHLVCALAKECPFFKDDECEDDAPETFDLKKYYDTCIEEQRVEDFDADLLLTDSTGKYNKPVLLEIAVTHKCSKEKRNSGLKIVEIKVRDEDDIEAIKEGPITERMAEFIGFSRESKSKIELKNRNIQRFYLYRNWSAYVTNMDDGNSCKYLHTKLQPHSVLELNIDSFYLADITPYEYGLVKAVDLGHKVKNCMLCKYHKSGYDIDRNVEMNPIFCCLHKSFGTPEYPKQTEANNCPYFKEDWARIKVVRESMKSITITVAE